MIQLALTLAIIGFVVWLLVTYVPMPAPIRIGMIAIVVVILIAYLMELFGIRDIPIPHLN